MKKKKIRCYRTFAQVAPNVFNYPVYFMAYEGWSNFSLATCINCGELFVIDWENPKTKGLSVQNIVGSIKCPNCKVFLKDTIKDYPRTIRLSDGKLGSYIPGTDIPPDHESHIVDFFEIAPST